MSLVVFIFLFISALDGNAMLTSADDGAWGSLKKELDERSEPNEAAIEEKKTMLNTRAGRKNDHVTIPHCGDWRDLGCVSPVGDQGACQSSWAFAAVGSVESRHCINTGKLVELSVQQLVNCVELTSPNVVRCAERSVIEGYDYMKKDGIPTEKDYPDLENDNCYTREMENIESYRKVAKGDEKALLEAVKQQPVAVTIDGSHNSFIFYTSGKKGIYEEPECSKETLTHSMLVVGYGTKGKGKDYWLVKNSYGTGWGMKGYILMPRNKHNYCGIASNASYPIVKKNVKN